MTNPGARRTRGTDILRLLAAGNYLVVADPADPRRLAIYEVDDDGHQADEPLAAGFRSKEDAQTWIRQRHNLPPATESQGDLWTPK